jgi:hypothetical protein
MSQYRIVIPYSFISQPDTRNQLVGNNVAAVICKGKMFYGIFGDVSVVL